MVTLASGRHFEEQRLEHAIRAAELQQKGTTISRDHAYGLILKCIKVQNLSLSRRMQLLILHGGLTSIHVLNDQVIRLLATCGSLVEANQYFSSVANPTQYTWSAVIAANAKQGEGHRALQLYDRMIWSGLETNKFVYLAVIKASIVTLTPLHGRLLHDQILTSGFEMDIVLGSSLVDMYAKCGKLEEAYKLFINLPSRNAISWGAMVAGYAQHGEGFSALVCYEEMQHDGIKPDKITFLSILKACGNISAIEHGKCIHEHIIQNGLQSDLILGNTVIDMYAKCGDMDQASEVFDKLPSRDVVSWTAMIAGCVQHGESTFAVDCFDNMLDDGVRPNRFTFSSVVKASISMGIAQGRRIHDLIIQSGFQSDIVLGSSLVDMYTKCGNLEEAWKVFHKFKNQDLVLWGTMIAGYNQSNEAQLALDCFDDMRQKCIKPDKFILLSVLSACGTIGATTKARCLHEHILSRNFQYDDALGSSLVEMYARCGNLTESYDILHKHGKGDVWAWDALIAGCSQHGNALLAFDCYAEMQQEGMQPTKFTFVNSLKACSAFGAIDQGKYIHEKIIKSGFESNAILGNTLVDMYCKCGSLVEAHGIFNRLLHLDVVSYGAMLAGHTQHGIGLLAIECYESMQCKCIRPNQFTFSSVLKSCGIEGAVNWGRCIHEQVIENGIQSDVVVGSTLVDMYSKCGNLGEAYKVFSNLPSRNMVSWGAMIAAYAQHDAARDALSCFYTMQSDAIQPDIVIFSSILKACGSISAIEHGRLIHEQIVDMDLQSDVTVRNALVHMYAKCGNIEEACDVFDSLLEKDVVSWDAMIAGYAQHGSVSLASHCLENMQHSGIKPGVRTFSSILTACNHAGLVDEGRRYFMSMSEFHGIRPDTFHFNCMVDVLGRAGYFREAENLLQLNKHNVSGWMTLLTACRLHGNMELGKLCLEEIIWVDCSNH